MTKLDTDFEVGDNVRLKARPSYVAVVESIGPHRVVTSSVCAGEADRWTDYRFPEEIEHVPTTHLHVGTVMLQPIWFGSELTLRWNGQQTGQLRLSRNGAERLTRALQEALDA